MDTATDILYTAQELAIRAATENKSSRPPVYKVVGLLLAIASGLFIGVSFVLKKLGLLKANVKYHEEAGEGYGYLKNAWWWSGMTLMIVGEICNFVAYAFVDAILVTPLGALSVVVTTILSAIFLKERLSFVGKVGCFNCIIGSVVIVINAPEQSAVATIQDMKKLVIQHGFLSYAGVIIAGCLFTALWAGPRYGKKSMLVYLSICSLIGGLSVVCTQGLGAAIVTQISGTPQFNQWFLYVVLVFVIATLLTEIIYLNKALNLFNAALVTPTYYVFFTSSTIVTSAVLFKGFHGTAATISTVIMGFLQICAGVVLLQLSKSAKDVPDAAVFKGDLDQVRTVAEQEEPEYEPRADTIRGGGAILRALSRKRTQKQVDEARRLQEEHMQTIGENEQVEWDGLRRRKTVLEPGQSPIVRRKTLHPPLGMTHFPDEDDRRSEESDIHPGFFTRLRQRAGTPHSAAQEPVPMSSLKSHDGASDSRDDTSTPQPHIYGLPPGLQRHDMDPDTSYHRPPGPSAIHWASSVDSTERARTPGGSLAPPRPPPHSAKRQFSFQNVFHRHKNEGTHNDGGDGDGESAGAGRPTSRGALSFSSRKGSGNHPKLDPTTEEERLGLVKGDSSANVLGGMPGYSSPPEYSDEEDWHMAGASGGSGGHSPPRLATPLGEETQGAVRLPVFAFERRAESSDEEADERYDRFQGKGFEKGDGRGGEGGRFV